MLFGEDASQWYVAMGQKWIGPMSASDIYEKVANHQISLAHYAWKKGQAEWRRICDIKTFQSLGPHQPQKAAQKQFQSEVSAQSTRGQTSSSRVGQTARSGSSSPSSSSSSSSKSGAARSPLAPAEARIWYLHQNQSQFGPFSREEITRFLKSGKIQPRVHGWRDGMKNWDRLERLPEFRDLVPSERASSRAPQRAPQRPSQNAPQYTSDENQEEDQRYSPRRPLVAKILVADQETVIVGVCRDISIGGLQVLTDTVPGDIGTKIKMNISPSSDEAGNPIAPFVAEGLIVRILEDGRGFSFRFTKLADRARQAIESYIESSS